MSDDASSPRPQCWAMSKRCRYWNAASLAWRSLRSSASRLVICRTASGVSPGTMRATSAAAIDVLNASTPA